MRDALEIMPSILLCWPTGSEADGGGAAVSLCCCVTVGSRGAVWQNGNWHGSVYEAKGWDWVPTREETIPTDIPWHWTRMETKQWMWAQWRVGASFQHWQQWVTSTGADFYKHAVQALVHRRWKCTANSGNYVGKQCVVARNVLYPTVLLCSL